MDRYKPLYDIDIDESNWTSELRNELHKSHPLFGKNFKALAKRAGSDDVLFLIDNSKYAIVHLTFNKETNSNFPIFYIYNSFEELKNNWEDIFGYSIEYEDYE